MLLRQANMQNIMVAIDGSASASYTVEVAADLTKAFTGQLLIVTVAAYRTGKEMRELARAEKNIGDVLEGLSMQIITAAEKCARRRGVTNIRHHIGWGDPARLIVEIAGQEAIDVIVIGRRGRGELPGLPLGAVAQKVVSLAPCSVIVVPELIERSPDDAPWS
jgi:nucleotide-binding universal stress UspA family protein